MDYEQPALFTWREFYNFRNHVLRVLRVFGTAGPMGEVDLSVVEENGPSFSSVIVENTEFFDVAACATSANRISIVECAPENIDAVVIGSLRDDVDVPRMAVSFWLWAPGMVSSSDAVLVGGRRFWDCNYCVGGFRTVSKAGGLRPFRTAVRFDE